MVMFSLWWCWFDNFSTLLWRWAQRAFQFLWSGANQIVDIRYFPALSSTRLNMSIFCVSRPLCHAVKDRWKSLLCSHVWPVLALPWRSLVTQSTAPSRYAVFLSWQPLQLRLVVFSVKSLKIETKPIKKSLCSSPKPVQRGPPLLSREANIRQHRVMCTRFWDARRWLVNSITVLTQMQIDAQRLGSSGWKPALKDLAVF